MTLNFLKVFPIKSFLIIGYSHKFYCKTWIFPYIFMVVGKLKLTFTTKKLNLLHLAGHVSCFIIFKEVLPQPSNIKASNRPVVPKSMGILSFLQNYYRRLNWRLIARVVNSIQLLKTSSVIKQYCLKRQNARIVN